MSPEQLKELFQMVCQFYFVLGAIAGSAFIGLVWVVIFIVRSTRELEK